MLVLSLCRGQFARGCLLALPIWCSQTGCGLADSKKVTQALSPPGAVPEVRSQQSEVIPAAATNLPPATLADGQVAVRVVAYVNKSPIFESDLRESVANRMQEVASLAEPERSQ